MRFVIMFLPVLFLFGCVTNPDGTKSFDWQVASDTARQIQSDTGAIMNEVGLGNSPIGVILSSVFGVAAAGFGAVAKFKSRRQKLMRETAISSVKAASEFIRSEDIQKFIESIKEIQKENGTRDEIDKMLTEATRVAKNGNTTQISTNVGDSATNEV